MRSAVNLIFLVPSFTLFFKDYIVKSVFNELNLRYLKDHCTFFMVKWNFLIDRKNVIIHGS